MEDNIYREIKAVIQKLDVAKISDERKQVLQKLIAYIQEKRASNELVQLNFICTHNSRRSHLSQVWAQTLAAFYKVDNVHCYSGGTETTAVYPMVIETLHKMGFRISKNTDNVNPIYEIKFAENQPGIIAFSKTFDDTFNPKSQFAAVMTCSDVDENCPFIPGAEIRIPLTFDDPKAFDNTPQQAAKYSERSFQIATELVYVFSNIKSHT